MNVGCWGSGVGPILLELQSDDLKELDIMSFGKRHKVMSSIKKLKEVLYVRNEAVSVREEGVSVREDVVPMREDVVPVRFCWNFNQMI
jgi:hypothetical protein